MDILTKLDGNRAVIKVDGRLDTVTAPELDSAIQEIIGELEGLELDFSSLSYVSSAGLRVILKAQKVMNKQGELVISNVQPGVMEVFEITGFVDILKIK